MKVQISKIKENPSNPRIIKDYKFDKLVNSIKTFPEMLDKRPIVVDENMIVLGGNMRLKACKEAGVKELEIIQVKDWTEEQKQEFIIKDNVNYGDWDWDLLANEWSNDQLKDWGLDVVSFDDHFEEETFDDESIAENKEEVVITFNMSFGQYEEVETEIQNIIKKYPAIRCKIQN